MLPSPSQGLLLLLAAAGLSASSAPDHCRIAWLIAGNAADCVSSIKDPHFQSPAPQAQVTKRFVNLFQQQMWCWGWRSNSTKRVLLLRNLCTFNWLFLLSITHFFLSVTLPQIYIFYFFSVPGLSARASDVVFISSMRPCLLFLDVSQPPAPR